MNPDRNERGGQRRQQNFNSGKKNSENKGENNKTEFDSSSRFQNSGGKQYNQRGKPHNNPRNNDRSYRNPQSPWGSHFQNRTFSGHQTQNANSYNQPESWDNNQNVAQNSHIPECYDRDAKNEFENATNNNNDVPTDTSEKVGEPAVVTEIPAFIGNIKVIRATAKFNNVFQRFLNSHPDKEKFLNEFLSCEDVVRENIDDLIPASTQLSANAPEFQMPTDQSNPNEPSESLQPDESVQDSYTDATNDKAVPDEVYNLQDVSDTVMQNAGTKEEKVEGAVGGAVEGSGDWWENKKEDDVEWGDDVEKDVMQTDEQQFEKPKKKFDNKKQNNFKDQGKHQRYRKVTEVSGDLFTASEDTSLAHCVGADLRMGSGIAVTFKRDFKSQAELLDQRKRVGEVAILENKDRFIYYLITKKYSTGKPRYEDLEKSLEEMKEHIVKHDVKKLAMPRIGCGLDRLEWSEVKPMIEKIFSDVDISITVYNLNQDKEERPQPRSKARFLSQLFPLVDMLPETGLVFFGAEDGSMDECGKRLDQKFNFALDFRKETKKVGSVLMFDKKNEYIYGLIVKKKETDPYSYVNFEKCLTELKKKTKKDKTYFIGFEAFCDGDDDLTTEKFISLVRTVFFSSENEIHICYPKNFEHLHPGDESRGNESYKNSEEMSGKKGQQGGERKRNFGNWNNPQGGDRKDTGRNWRN